MGVWTPSDAADAADDQRDREWWKRDPYADPYADETFTCEVCGKLREESDMDSQILANHPTFKAVCSDCADPILIKWGIA